MGQKYSCALEEPMKGVYLEVVNYDNEGDVNMSITSYAGNDVIVICLTKEQVSTLISELQNYV